MPSKDVDSFSPLRRKLRHVIFDHNDRVSRGFDVILLWLIALSVLAVMLESMRGIASEYRKPLLVAEWVFTIVFMVEYFLRLWTSRNPRAYAFSFLGIVDLISWIPMFLIFFLENDSAHFLTVVRILRLLRVFRVLKLMPLVGEADVLMASLRRSRPKILVFMAGVLILAILMGTIMYLIEGQKEGSQFSSIPTSVYWTIVTITTVGFGDITPETPLGKLFASCMMLIGYAIIAVPTGIVASDVYDEARKRRNPAASGRSCDGCNKDGHRDSAKFCWNCGDPLEKPEAED